jgi:hypothetical protein
MDDRSRQTVPQARLFLRLLLCADAAFIAIHLVHKLSPYLLDPHFSIEADRGYAEVVQYVKAFWVALMLAAVWRSTRARVHAVWAAIYAYIVCDDATRLHERAGLIVAEHTHYGTLLGLRARDLGELTFAFALATALLALLFVLYRRSCDDARHATQDLVLLFGLLGFCGVFVDMLHVLSTGGPAEALFSVLEDGGEMVALSMTCAYAFDLLQRRGERPVALWVRLCPPWLSARWVRASPA